MSYSTLNVLLISRNLRYVASKTNKVKSQWKNAMSFTTRALRTLGLSIILVALRSFSLAIAIKIVVMKAAGKIKEFYRIMTERFRKNF